MNIHVDKMLGEELIKKSYYQTIMGSRLYGTANENSDTDILMFFAESKLAAQTPFFNQHQFQYKKDGIDYVFTSMRGFIYNLVSGDSSINTDVLFLSDICDVYPILSLLRDEAAKVYPIIRCFLGLAKRDVNQYRRTSPKKLVHANRGLKMVECLLEKGFYTKEDVQFQPLNDQKTCRAWQKRLRLEVNDLYQKDVLQKCYSIATQLAITKFLDTLPTSESDELILSKIFEANLWKEFRYE